MCLTQSKRFALTPSSVPSRIPILKAQKKTIPSQSTVEANFLHPESTRRIEYKLEEIFAHYAKRSREWGVWRGVHTRLLLQNSHRREGPVDRRRKVVPVQTETDCRTGQHQSGDLRKVPTQSKETRLPSLRCQGKSDKRARWAWSSRDSTILQQEYYTQMPKQEGEPTCPQLAGKLPCYRQEQRCAQAVTGQRHMHEPQKAHLG